jgi:MoaA/NifB/PqqE/SkfB family radical SAM enzyme
MKRAHGEMKLDTFKMIADEVTMYQNTRLWLAFMGEPLLRYGSLRKMIRYANDIGLTNIHLNTNGVYLYDYIADELGMMNVQSIIVSIDGLTKETYDRIRIGSDFDVVVNNTKYLLRQRSVIVQIIEQKANEHEIESFVKYWNGLGAIVKVRLKAGWGNPSWTEGKLDHVQRDFPCPWLIRALPILWNGDFALCDGDYERDHHWGNIHEESIYDNWNNRHAPIRAEHWDGNFDFEPCRNCLDWAVGRSRFYYPNGRVA